MKISYRFTTILFFVLYLLPIIGVSYLVYQRIQQRQATLQFYLQNQVDVDRQIISERGDLRNVQPKIRNFLLTEHLSQEGKVKLAEVKDARDEFEKFWKKYENNYTASQRPFLQKLLDENQEHTLIDDEARVLTEIQRKGDVYFSRITAYPALNGVSTASQDDVRFLGDLDDIRNDVFASLNDLADIRYIFAQRVVFFVTGENDLQQGFFNTIFVGIFFITLILYMLETFFIHKPFKDIMLFLRDLGEGKRGQRLYFSSPVKEIKNTEEIINTFVDKAEQHEKEK